MTWKAKVDKQEDSSLSGKSLGGTQENTAKKIDAPRPRPEPSYVPLSYMRYNHPTILLEYYEGLAGLKRYKTQS